MCTARIIVHSRVKVVTSRVLPSSYQYQKHIRATKLNNPVHYSGAELSAGPGIYISLVANLKCRGHGVPCEAWWEDVKL